MSLKAQVEETGRELSDLADTLEGLSIRVRAFAATIPTPEEARASDERIASEARNQAITERTHANGDPRREAVLNGGAKIGRRDRNGKKLRVGDLIEVTDSERYDTVRAVVLGPGHDHGDGRKRVHCALLDGRDDDYHPSCSRMERLLKMPKMPKISAMVDLGALE